jgi:hypothetical protein
MVSECLIINVFNRAAAVVTPVDCDYGPAVGLGKLLELRVATGSPNTLAR